MGDVMEGGYSMAHANILAGIHGGKGVITTKTTMYFPSERNIEKYLDDLEYFLDLIEENLDFKIKDVLNRRQIKRKHGITVESEQEKAALAMYKVACKLAKDWESFWCRRD